MTLSRGALTDLLVAALDPAGLVVDMQTGVADRPLLLQVRSADGQLDLRIFLWNITRGGPAAVRAATEYRVQTRRPGNVPFRVDDGRHTLLLGYHEATGTFTAWEVRAHPNPGSSSSLQVSLETLERARDAGFASQTRDTEAGGREVVVAFQPSLLPTYLGILPALRATIVDDSDAVPAQTATEGIDPRPEELPDAGERQIVIRQIAARVRDARFRARVTAAYGGRCAFCDLDLGLVDAAHLEPVAGGGPDQIVNGIAACPNHHRALDRGLLLVEDDLQILVNDDRASELGFAVTDVDALRSGLRSSLRPPNDPSLTPDPVHLAAHRDRWVSY